MRNQSLRTAVRVALMAAVSCFAVLAAVWPKFGGQIVSGQNDFLAMYAGAKLAFTDQLYNPDAIRQVQVDSALATAEGLGARAPATCPGSRMITSPLGAMSSG